MKRYILTLMMVLTTAIGVKAMSYNAARQEALYLTDKMAYELNLNDQQYNDAYEINLDYLLSLNTADDLYGTYLDYRLTDFRHILYDWQWNLFYAADYFLRPVMWRGGGWFYPIYSIYDRGWFFYDRPHVFFDYRGGHGRDHFHDGFYAGRRPGWNGGMRGGEMGGIRHEAGRNGVRGNYIQGRGMNFRDGQFQRGGESMTRGGGNMSRGSESMTRGGSDMRQSGRSNMQMGRSSDMQSSRSHGDSFGNSSSRVTGSESMRGSSSARGSYRGGSSMGGSTRSYGGSSMGGNSTRSGSSSMGSSMRGGGSSMGGGSTRGGGSMGGGNPGGGNGGGGSHGGGRGGR